MRTLFLLATMLACAEGEVGDLPDAAAATDAAAGDAAATDSGAIDAGINQDPLCSETAGDTTHQVLRFEGGGIVLWLTRDNVGPGGGRTTAFEARRFTIEREDRSECVTSPSQMQYNWTHHNWQDSMEATADGVSWKLSMILDTGTGDWDDTLEGRDSGGAVTVGPLEMTLIEGPRL